MRVMVTGGLGFIGAHTCVELANAGERLLIVDNLANTSAAVLPRIRELAPGAEIEFVRADVRDAAAMAGLFAAGDIESVIHFAGLKAVGESVAKPLEYYDNNVNGAVTLLNAMARSNVELLVFSSSATVYGEPERLPLTEDHRLQATNPYGRTKLMIEQIIADQAAARASFRHATLRYFNPIGAHASGRIGEDPRGVPNNLFPYLTQVAVGRLPRLRVFGGDYATPDGTGVRDYIHVVDLALGHLAALKYLREKKRSITVNLGTGRGYSVLEVVQAFERSTGRKVPFEIVPRRAGDSASSYADTSFAAGELGWRARFGIVEMCRDAWRWQSDNPSGFPD
ncbi:MAG TPA: UDP-glucose 4-epimerase GalE [Burkholderiales bacterium]|nr:UDP-glucose 4-epimerase GalE [Burkholderiales bacterium]